MVESEYINLLMNKSNIADKPIAFIVLIINLTEINFAVSTSVNHDATRNRDIGIFEFSLIRNLLCFLIAIPVFLFFGKSLFEDVTRETMAPLVIRILFGNIAFFTWTAVFKFLPLGIGQVICSSNPFVVVLLTWCLFAADKPGFDDLIGIVVSFIGIVIMAGSKPASDVEVIVEDKNSHYLAGFVFAGVTMFFLAILPISGRFLKSIHFSII
jgi:drug/metabolite transporter (DMT)-like permease